MTHPKNQHYVSQFLLRNFASTDVNKIWCYDKKYKKDELRSILNVASEVHFYDKIPGQKEGSFEYIFARAETDTSPIINKIITSKSINNLSIDEKITLSLFIILQLNRTKTALESAKDINNQLKEGLNRFLNKENVSKDYLSDTETWHGLLYSTPDLSMSLLEKTWVIFESNRQFLTSDNPVVLQNVINNNKNRGTLGLKSIGIQIYFPLSDSILLSINCEKSIDKNLLSTYKLNDDNIENINSLQVINSERFIFSSQRNFELVIDMVSKNEI